MKNNMLKKAKKICLDKKIVISLQTEKNNNSKESCLRGRKDMFAKHAYWKRYQGFESLTLR